VFSTDATRLAQLTQAIDDLAAMGWNGLPPEELAERVAEVWTLVEGLDPELTRRRSGYADSSLATLRRSAGSPA
jgi:hypothetical protein